MLENKFENVNSTSELPNLSRKEIDVINYLRTHSNQFQGISKELWVEYSLGEKEKTEESKSFSNKLIDNLISKLDIESKIIDDELVYFLNDQLKSDLDKKYPVDKDTFEKTNKEKADLLWDSLFD